MEHIIFLLLGLCLLGFSRSEQHYDGYKVFSVDKVTNKTQYMALAALQKRPRLDFWSDPSFTRSTDIMVDPTELHNVEKYLYDHQLPYKIAIPDVQRFVEKDLTHRENRQGGMNWKKYHQLDVIHAWMESQAIQNPRLVRVFNIGTSTERRPIKAVEISAKSYKKNPAIVIDAGIHAREWIAPATATYMMKQLLSVSLEDRDLIDSLDWYFIPVVNPDGYEYTHTEDRLWRKTRSKHPEHPENCYGVDANRNFNFHWGEAGTKDDPCANTYPGPSPFSEPEANATATFLWNNRGKIKAYLTLHSYSQLFLTPYGYTEDLPDDYDELQELGQKAANALEEVHGTEYEVGAPSHILYANSGSSRDWAKGVAEIKYPFTIELRDKGEAGFVLPPSEILPTAEETWEAVKVIARQVVKEAYKGNHLYSGSSQDWAREEAKVKYAYTLELRDAGNRKFLLPEEEIEESGEETWEAIKVFARQVIQEFSPKQSSPIKHKISSSFYGNFQEHSGGHNTDSSSSHHVTSNNSEEDEDGDDDDV